jgi:Kdo2-lipid IVA lauroyltransferase/acyltransferase
VKNAPVRHALEYALAAPLLALVGALPHVASRPLGAALGELVHAADRRRRRVAQENLAQALPELAGGERRRLARQCFRHFGAVFLDGLSAARFDRVELCRRTEGIGLEHLARAEERGRGVILLSAHFGNWEIVPPYVALARGPMAAVGRPVDNPWIDRRVRALRERFGNQLLDKRGAVREMFRVLRAGGRLGLLIDQRVRPAEAIDVPFFGRPALTSPIVARLALKTGAPIVPVVGDHRPGGRYRVEFLEPLLPEGRDDDASTFELTRRAVAVGERTIRAAPERWLWMHDRWRH